MKFSQVGQSVSLAERVLMEQEKLELEKKNNLLLNIHTRHRIQRLPPPPKCQSLKLPQEQETSECPL